VEAHRGVVLVESTGRGTRFTVLLPLGVDEAEGPGRWEAGGGVAAAGALAPRGPESRSPQRAPSASRVPRPASRTPVVASRPSDTQSRVPSSLS
jgi:hypothetical protein